MRTLDVERLVAGDYALIKPLLVELHLTEQIHYEDHPQLPREEIERHLASVPSAFSGFCWIVLYDPGTGLEGEIAELYVAEGHRGRGIGEMLVRQAVSLFAERRVTLAYVWTRPDNEKAVKLYRSVGFEPNRQLVMTWYPIDPVPES